METLRDYTLYALIGLLLIYAGLKAYVYFGVKDQMERLDAMVRPFSQVTYDGIASSLLAGSVSVENIEVKQAEKALPLRIRSTTLSGDGIGFLFDLSDGFSSGRMPEAMALDMWGVELHDPQSLLPENLSLGANAQSPLSEPPDPCSLKGLVQRIGLFRSDSYPLIVDFNMAYGLDTSSSVGEIKMGYQVRNRESLEWETRVSGLVRPGDVLVGVVPEIEHMGLTYRPGYEYVTGLVHECARTIGLSPPLYVGGLLSQSAELLANELGFIPGPGLRQAMQTFLLEPKSLSAEIGPVEEPMALTQANLTPQQTLEFLGLRLFVNDAPINDLSYEEVPSLEPSKVEEEEREARAKRRRIVFLDTPPTELERYIGREARLFVKNHDRPHRGVIVEVKDEEVSIQKQVRRGKFTVHVPISGIEKAMVKRYADGS